MGGTARGYGARWRNPPGRSMVPSSDIRIGICGRKIVVKSPLVSRNICEEMRPIVSRCWLCVAASRNFNSRGNSRQNACTTAHAALRAARGLIVRNRTQVCGPILDAAPALKVVGRLGVGLDNLTPEVARKLGLEDTGGVLVELMQEPPEGHH